MWFMTGDTPFTYRRWASHLDRLGVGRVFDPKDRQRSGEPSEAHIKLRAKYDVRETYKSERKGAFKNKKGDVTGFRYRCQPKL